MSPLVSIGLPFHNNAVTIEEALRSIFAQTYPHWELILVDDGSSDGSRDLVARLDDPRVRAIRDEQNLGLPARLNQIATMASGDYLARMDADDVMHPERIERQLAFLQDHPEVDIVGSGLVSIDDQSRPTGQRSAPPTDVTPRSVLLASRLVHVSITGKTSWFRANPYDESYRRAQDHELWVRTFEHATVASLDAKLMFVREHGTITARKYASSAQAGRRILRSYGPRMLGRPQTLELIGRSYVKEAIYRGLELFGAVDRAVSRRNVPLSDEERDDAVVVLRRVQSTPLPLIGTRETAGLTRP